MTKTNRSHPIKGYFDLEEKAAVSAKAEAAGLSISELLRRTALGTPLPRTLDHEAIGTLARINGDLARLGNLFKLALDQKPIDPNLISEMIASIKITHGEFREAMQRIK